VCSGIEAATVAWHSLGWTPVFFSEIEPFPCAALAHHYPEVPNYGDMTKFQEWPDAAIDVLVGGTPCQSFSVAGLRKGLADPRGNLALTFLAIADKYRPQWVLWENVPGVLSSKQGRDFGSFLGGLAGIGYGWAYRVLDAQYFGVAQRRRRVFVVGSARSWASAAAVLFERESLHGNPAPSRESGKEVAANFGSRAGSGGGFSTHFEAAGDLTAAHSLEDGSGIPLIAGCLNSAGGHAVPGNSIQDADQGYLIPYAPPVSHCLNAGGMGRQDWETETLVIDSAHVIATQVRRLTPRECERLQGFPDDYTLIPHRGKPAADGPRYKALGNSMAVPCMQWIGERIALVQRLTDEIG
jgi:DNA (cytosine-5)-methyltransferase 1